MYDITKFKTSKSIILYLTPTAILKCRIFTGRSLSPIPLEGLMYTLYRLLLGIGSVTSFKNYIICCRSWVPQ